jgi:hypothetical protein
VADITDQTPKPEAPSPENTPSSGGSRWVKGISGNPGGRPKVEGEIRNLARKYSRTAVRRLAQLVKSKNERVAVAAATALLDRAWGRPAQALTGPGGAPLMPSSVFVGINAITDPGEAARVYAEILGNPSLDLSGITFALPAPSAVVAEVPRNAAPLPMEARIAPVETDKAATWEALSK